jgi:hypothetical protein
LLYFNFLDHADPDKILENFENLKKLADSDKTTSVDTWRGDGVQDHNSRISGHINIDFVNRCVSEFGYKDVSLPSHILRGFPLKGKTPRSHVFPLKEEFLDEAENVSDFGEEVHSDGLLRNKKPSWLEEDLRKHVEHEFATLAKNGDVTIISQEEAVNALKSGGSIAYCFAVDQSSAEKVKLRSIVNYSDVNEVSEITEKLTLPTHNLIAAKCAYAFNKTDLGEFLQSKKDVQNSLNDAETKTNLMNGIDLCEGNLDTPRKKQKLNINPCTQRWQKLVQRAVARSEQKNLRKIKIVAVDFKSAYLQLSCCELNDNICAVWSDVEEKYIFYRSGYMHFGSRAAVHAWTRVANLFVFILRELIGVDVDIYVDDSFC